MTAPTTLALVRHGESSWIAEGRFQGRGDPPLSETGLRQATDVLKEYQDIGFAFFSSADVVRHPLVQRIISAYEAYERKVDK